MLVRRLRIGLSVVLGAVLLVGTNAVPAAHADTNVTLPLAVNFQAQTTTTPAGYKADYGLAYSATVGYGWTNTAGVATSMVGNGRERNVAADKTLDTFVAMQLGADSDGVHTEGMWKAAVPNGTYQVTVAAGDPSYTDSHDVIRVEGSTVIDFTPSGTTTSQVNTTTVGVTDGFLNVDQTGGSNTKIDYIKATAVAAGAPYIVDVSPANGATGVTTTPNVTLRFSNGINGTTVNSTNFKLLAPGGAQVAGFYNIDGAASNGTFVASAALSQNTMYTVSTTTGLKDPQGNSYPAFTSTFTVGTSGTTQAPVSFTKSTFATHDSPIAFAFEPGGGALYASFGDGSIIRYALDANGKVTGTPTTITTFQFKRNVIGLRFDPASTATNIKLWVSNGQFGCDLASTGTACTDFTGAISVLTGTSASNLTSRDVVTGLPRSVGDHQNNGLDFGPDGKLYWAQAANNGYGAEDPTWGNRDDHPLTAAILVADVDNDSRLTGGTVNANTSTGYDPTVANAAVKTYVTGTRNPFDIVWASNGKLYAPVNESSNGNSPAGPNNKPPGLTSLPAFDDYFTHLEAGKYYGHPNPSRNQFVLNAGNPTSGVDGPFEVPQYPVGTAPDSNYKQPDLDVGNHRSADGVTEFTSNVFGANLQGQFLVTEYAGGKDVIAIKTDANGNAVSESTVMTGFNNPLPIISDPTSGRVYVGEYGADPSGAGGQIDLLTPAGVTNPPPPPPPGNGIHVNFGAQTTAAISGYSLDYGQAFNTTSGYGWEDQTSGAALSLVGNGRDRGVLADKRLDTFVHMQLIAGATGVTTPGKWEATLANGTYNVTVGVGDPSNTDSHDLIRAEGATLIDYTPTTTAPNSTATKSVTITDGKLTLDAIGGSNTKIDFVDAVLTSTPVADTTPPTVTVTPSGTTDTSGNYVGSATVTIGATDTGSGVKNTTYTLDGGVATAYNAPFVVSTVGPHTVVGTSVDNSNNTGTATKTFTVVAGTTPPGGTFAAKVDFQAQTSTPAAGYQADYGLAFNTTAGFGWENTSGSAVSLVGNGRERDVNSDPRLDTFMHMQLGATSDGVKTPGQWEMVVPNGTYSVTIGTGDPSNTDSHDVLRAEGTTVLDFTPSGTTPQATATKAGIVVSDGRLTIDAVGGANTKIDYIDISGSTTGTTPPPGDTTPPTVTVTPSGTTDTTGAYKGSATVTVNATDAGGIKTVTYKLDGGAVTNYTAPFAVSTVGSHSVVVTATDNSNNATTVTKTFTVVANTTTPPPSGQLAVTSPQDILANGSRLIFSTVKAAATPAKAVTIKNTSTTAALNVTGLTISGTNASSFKLATGQATSFSIPANGTQTVNVLFTPTATYENYATLTIASSSTSNPSYAVALSGMNPSDYEGDNEPSLQQIADVLGYKVNIGVTGSITKNTISSSPSLQGDEVAAQLFTRVDSTKPVNMYLPAEYEGRETYSSSTLGWYDAGSTSVYGLYSTPGGVVATGGGENQKFFPAFNSGGVTAFNPSSQFGLEDGDGSYTQDAKNPNGVHNYRTYPVKNAAGVVIPNTYLIGDDIGGPADDGKNYDAQDFVFLLTNAAPVSTAAAPGAASLNLSFASSVAGSVADKNGVGTGFNFIQANTAGTQSKPANITESTTAKTLSILSTAGTASGATNTQQNQLMLPFQGSNANWHIQARVNGPFTNLTQDTQSEGIIFGPDQDNFAKLEVENDSGNVVVTLYVEQAGVGTVVYRTAVAQSATIKAATTLDLILAGNKTTHAVTPSYSINGGTAVALGAASVVPAAWFSTASDGGIIVSNEASTATFTAVYKTFVIAAN